MLVWPRGWMTVRRGVPAVRLCADCRWFLADGWVGDEKFGPHACARPSLVSGKPVMLAATTERYLIDHEIVKLLDFKSVMCGPFGRYWEGVQV